MSQISYNDKTWHGYTLPKIDPKNIWITWHTPWILLISAFFTRNQQILLHQEIQIWIAFWYIISNSFKFYYWIFKDCFNKHGYNLMMPANIAAPGFRKIKVYWKKDYGVIISTNDVPSKFVSRDSNYIVDVVMWPKFCDSSISMKEVIISSSL